MRENRATILSVCATTTLTITLLGAWGQQPAEQVTLTGKVIDVSGQPVRGARVRLYRCTHGDARYVPGPSRVADITVGGDGVYSFSVPAEASGYRYEWLFAEKEGLAIGFASWDMKSSQTRNITLGAPTPLGGVVVDEHSEPISDATVSIYLLRAERGGQEHGLSMYLARRLLTTRTDAVGRFTFLSMPAGTTAELLVKKPGRATVCTFDPATYRGGPMHYTVGQNDIRIVQPAEGRIEGRVVHRDTGAPIPGVQLVVTDAHNRLLDGYDMIQPALDGTFVAPGLPAGQYTLELADRQAGSAEWVAAPVPVTVEAGKTITDVKIDLSQGGVLEVAVTVAAGDKPLEKASVGLRAQGSSRRLSGVSDAEGVARIRLLPGTYQLQGVYKEGYVYDGRPADITIMEGATRRMAATMKKTPNICGVVRDPEGALLPGVRIVVLPFGQEGTASDSEGRFEIAWTRRNWGRKDTTLCVVARDKQRNLAATVDISEDTGELDIKLAPGVTLTGRVADPNGGGIAGARIRPMLNVSNVGSPLSRTEDRADDGGCFTIPGLPAGSRYDVDASADGYGNQRVRVEAMNAVDGQLDIGTLTLPVANLTISGRVVDMAGQPVSNAIIEGYGQGQPSRCSTQADIEGAFTLAGVCAGRINIEAEANQGGRRLSAHVLTDGGASDMRIVVREGHSPIQYLSGKSYEQIIAGSERVIAGVAVDEKGVPVAGVPVNVCCHKAMRDGRMTWMFSSFPGLSNTTDAQGRFAIALEEDGEYNLRFSPDDLAAEIIYEVPVGKRDLRVTLPTGGTLTGRLVRVERGRKVPIPHAEVKIEQTDRYSYTHLGFGRDRTTTTDSDGRFRVEHLATRIRVDRTKDVYGPRFWKVSYGEISKTIAFETGNTIEDFELVVRPEPADASPLKGNPLPEFDGSRIDLPAERTQGRKLLLCFFDMNQRPSRHYVQQLARRTSQLADKDVLTADVQMADMDAESLAAWTKESGIDFPVGTVQADVQGIKYAFAIRSLPWLILTDRTHKVRSAGFGIHQLSEKIKEMTDGKHSELP